MKNPLQIAGISTILALSFGILGCGDDSSKLYATWNLVSLSDNGKTIDVSKAEQGAAITIEKDKFNGNAGCNGIFGAFAIKGKQLEFGNVGATRKLCAPESMAVEDTLMKLFADTAVAFDLQGDKLVLERADGTLRAVFEAKSQDSSSEASTDTANGDIVESTPESAALESNKADSAQAPESTQPQAAQSK